MSDFCDSLKQSEYSSLREEMLQNKRYVFERPLLIITAAGIASIQLSGRSPVVLLPITLIAILLLNLWFTVNRLKSTARIASYIEVFIEEEKVGWVGWERALRTWRLWNNKDPQYREKKVKLYIDSVAIPSSMMYYPPIYWFHVVTVIVALVVSFLLLIEPSNGGYSTWDFNNFGFNVTEALAIYPSKANYGSFYLNNLKLFAFIMSVAVSIIFAYYSIRRFRPKKMENLIEQNRATWLAVFLDMEMTPKAQTTLIEDAQ